MGSASEGRSGARLAIATCAELPELDREGGMLLAACREAGIDARPVVWDDGAVDWGAFETVLIRSTWDYPAKQERFAAWARARGERLLNPLAAVEWNLSKRYLKELERWGLPIVPTAFIAPGDEPELPAAGEFVVKPAVSAGSRDTARYGAEEGERAVGHVSALLDQGRDVLVQPYLGSVETAAETAVILLGGELSHAMRKGPLLERHQGVEQGLFRQEEMSPRQPDPAESRLASAVLERFSAEVCAPLYARVDLLRSDGGEPCILELELIEPSLFLDHHPAAIDRLVGLLRG